MLKTKILRGILYKIYLHIQHLCSTLVVLDSDVVYELYSTKRVLYLIQRTLQSAIRAGSFTSTAQYAATAPYSI